MHRSNASGRRPLVCATCEDAPFSSPPATPNVWGREPELVGAGLLTEGGNGPIQQLAVAVARPQPLSVLHVFLHVDLCGYVCIDGYIHTYTNIQTHRGKINVVDAGCVLDRR